MSKPHEETWETGEGVLSGALYADGIWIGSFTNSERARLAKEAPMLAQLLLGYGSFVRGEWHIDDCLGDGHGEGCEEQRAALKAAGVLK